MAIAATAQWEVRSTGSQYNGAGFDTGIAGYGTDYTQQDAAQLTLTDLASTVASNIVTSATGGFTAAMVGNALYIRSGTNFTAGYYFIIARNSNNSVTVDRSPVGGSNGSGGTGSIGGGSNGLTATALWSAVVAGNTIWMKNGAYAVTNTINIAAGTTTNGTKLKGYNVFRGDTPTGANRPAITTTTVMTLGIYASVENIIVNSSHASGCFSLGTSCFLSNCVANQTGGGAKNAITTAAVNGTNKVFGCRAISNGIGGIAINNIGIVIGCYVQGYTGVNGAVKVLGCVVDSCGNKGIALNNHGAVVNCDIYNCPTGITITSADTSIINNIISNCATVGVTLTGGNVSSAHCDYNCLYSNGANYTGGLSAGVHDLINTNPLMNNPAAQDFTLQAGSPCLAAGRSNGVLTGLTQSYKWNIGVDQADHVAPPSGPTDLAHWM